MISLSKKIPSSSYLMTPSKSVMNTPTSKSTTTTTTTPAVSQTIINNNNNNNNKELSDSKTLLSSSVSFDSNLKNASTSITTNIITNQLETPGKKATSPVLGTSMKDNIKFKNTPTSRQSIIPNTNFQKYYSFQKSSYNNSEYKCTCFNMPFVCEICTTR
jgi:hypothetical protein